MRQLESLYLINCAVDAHSVENILVHCVNLKEIEVTLSGCTVDEFLNKISKLRHLTKLIINNGTCLSAAGTKLIATFCALKEIRLKGITKIEALNPSNVSELFTSQGLKALIILELDISILNDDCIITVATKCRNLEIFKISNCKNVSDAGIKYLAKHCPELREVSLLKCVNVSEME